MYEQHRDRNEEQKGKTSNFGKFRESSLSHYFQITVRLLINRLLFLVRTYDGNVLKYAFKTNVYVFAVLY